MKTYNVYYNAIWKKFQPSNYRFVGTVKANNKMEALFKAQRDDFEYKHINTDSFGSNYPFKITD